MTDNKELQMLDESYLSQTNFEHYFRVANMMSKTDLVPKQYRGKPQDILVAMEYGRTLGIGPMQAIQNIASINGKPAAYGDLLLAVCTGRPDFENMKEEYFGEPVAGCRCTIKRKGRDAVTAEFTVEQAKKAGLWGKPGPWSQYPERMLKMRARAFAIRDVYADALMGVCDRYEAEDMSVIPQDKASRKIDINDELSNVAKRQEKKVETLN